MAQQNGLGTIIDILYQKFHLQYRKCLRLEDLFTKYKNALRDNGFYNRSDQANPDLVYRRLRQIDSNLRDEQDRINGRVSLPALLALRIVKNNEFAYNMMVDYLYPKFMKQIKKKNKEFDNNNDRVMKYMCEIVRLGISNRGVSRINHTVCCIFDNFMFVVLLVYVRSVCVRG